MLALQISERVQKTGTDEKLLHDSNGTLVHMTLAEKLLLPILVKLTSFDLGLRSHRASTVHFPPMRIHIRRRIRGFNNLG
ncbi:MAG: hypothetical protein AAF802_26165 [Planctomycetota bacterium]